MSVQHIWNVKYVVGNPKMFSKVTTAAGGPMRRAEALANAEIIAKSGRRVWVEHHRQGKRIFESEAEKEHLRNEERKRIIEFAEKMQSQDMPRQHEAGKRGVASVKDINQYPAGTRIRIGDRLFQKVGTGAFWREEHEIPGNCVSRPAASIEHIEHQEGQPHAVIGVFADWDGKVRDISAPGDGYTCAVRTGNGHLYVEVIDGEGFVIHEADYHPDIAALEARITGAAPA